MTTGDALHQGLRNGRDAFVRAIPMVPAGLRDEAESPDPTEFRQVADVVIVVRVLRHDRVSIGQRSGLLTGHAQRVADDTVGFAAPPGTERAPQAASRMP